MLFRSSNHWSTTTTTTSTQTPSASSPSPLEDHSPTFETYNSPCFSLTRLTLFGNLFLHITAWLALLPPFCHIVTLANGEEDGTPLQYSCLENPVEGGAWWAAVHGVAKSRTRLKRLSSSSSTLAKTLLILLPDLFLFTALTGT